MAEQKQPSPRRTFLLQAAGLAGAGSLGSAGVAAVETAAAAVPAPAPVQAATIPYQSLSPAEATFIEALVDVLCPADEHSPSGVDCGLATYIDHQLAGAYGQGDGRYQRGPFRTGKPEFGLQVPLTPEQFCKAGIAAANAASIRDHGKPFDQLAPAVADEFLKAVEADRVRSDGVSLALWFNEVIYRLFVEACFADPLYGGNRDVVFWKMIGYPGLPAAHALDMVRYRGKPYPGAKNPKSIADFT
ncbi:MAG TPA: gluconate 2-dehydrogenase subunit 3 family protein [Steroidobacteraceae bacterium]|nr:gluconate 2-dehydrogenase subunit 3 family protein [Steroidobacteraceae bacterium]